MARFIIEGGRPLNGSLRPTGNKNAALPMLAACLLTEEPVELTNLPRIDDVEVMIDLISALGVDVQRRGRSVTLCAKGLKKTRLPSDLCRRVRTSILLAGPLAMRLGKATLPPPGGDVIGRRRLDTHFHGLRALGIEVDAGTPYRFRRARPGGADLLLDEASVTATEHILMTAAMIEEPTVIYNAACEPHVQDLGGLLQKMGARVDGLGTNRIVVHGSRELQGARHRIQPDHVEAGSYLAAAAATGGNVSIEGVPPDALRVVERTFDRIGVRCKLGPNTVTVSGKQRPVVRSDLGAAIPKVEDGAWPAFPSDLMSVALVLATQAKGTVLFFEKMFESRMYFVDHLIDMGARLVQCDPHRVLVTGPTRLQGSHLSSPDIRAGMALIIAALCAEGRSVIENAHVVDRGYEAIDRRLRSLGARIRRES